MLRTLALLSLTAFSATAQTVASLQKEVTAQQAQIQTLVTEVAALQKSATNTVATDTAQSSAVAQLQSKMNTVLTSNVWALNPFVAVDLNPENGVIPPNLVFTANVHIVNGTGQTGLVNGLGNLIIGADEALPPGAPSASVTRTGSHNLVLGRYNQFAGFGGYVGGESNTILGQESVVIGGHLNQAIGPLSVDVAGIYNVSEGGNNVNVAGNGNYCTGSNAVSVSGSGNVNSTAAGVVLGGEWNNVSGIFTVALGGFDYLVQPPLADEIFAPGITTTAPRDNP